MEKNRSEFDEQKQFLGFGNQPKDEKKDLSNPSYKPKIPSGMGGIPSKSGTSKVFNILL